MTTETLSSYSLLGANTELQTLLKELDKKRQEFSFKEEEVKQKVQEIQRTCTHPKFLEERSKKDSWDGINMLVSKTCTECGEKQERPKGSSYEICENCWGQMKYEGREPGQGGGTQHYSCEKCKHHHTHT